MLPKLNGWPMWALSALVTLLIGYAGYATAVGSWLVQDWYEQHQGVKQWSVQHEALSSLRLNTHDKAIETWMKTLREQLAVDTDLMLQIEELRGEYKVLRERVSNLRENGLNRRK